MSLFTGHLTCWFAFGLDFLFDGLCIIWVFSVCLFWADFAFVVWVLLWFVLLDSLLIYLDFGLVASVFRFGVVFSRCSVCSFAFT